MSSVHDEADAFPIQFRENDQLRALFALHAEHLETSPVLAHWTAAGFSTILGFTLASCRGLFVAGMQPAGTRLQTFGRTTRAVAPLYIIPFVLGGQLDCYDTVARKNAAARDLSTGAADLG